MSGRRGFAGIAVVMLVVLALAVGGVVVLLRSIGSEVPTASVCTATDGTTSASLDPDQAATAAMITGIAVTRGLPARAATIALATAMQESKLRNIDYGDRDSIGLFQQRPSQGWGTVEEIMDPVYSTNTFYDALVQVEGYQDMEITEAAQTVQRSGYPEAYAQHETMARMFASALTGFSNTALVCRLPSNDVSLQTDVLIDLLARDLTSASVEVLDGAANLAIDVGDPSRSPWVIAHWAVATASITGASEVVVGELAWTRDSAENGWHPADEPVPAGTVLVR